ncbi:ABC transporter substrate-binding protein [Shewanella sp. UCD-KL12]|uniref:substrate-binding periplasmic protein n=1 Tax=Shewanella sp. UCD-KL12 TaxID=1917163 RepID=UPI000970FA63|nr:transporter substrate-binding domain-containing protein [Shewanella sp. UCD-KL12]
MTHFFSTKVHIALYSLLALGYLSISSAQGETIQSSSIIEIRTIDILPYGIRTRIKGQTPPEFLPSGIYFDMANQLAIESGYQPHNKIYPYARIMLELKSGQTDMTIMFKYKELEDYVTYIAALPSLKNVVIGLKGTNYASFDSLKGKRIAYLRGAKFSDRVDNDPDIYRFETLDFVQAIKVLIAGRVDAVIGPMDPIISAAKQLNKDITLFGEPFVVSERTPWVQVSNKSLAKISVPQLKSQFDKLIQQEALLKIRKRYLGKQ